MTYELEFFYQNENHTRQTSWIHLEHLLNWVLHQPGCELVRVELIDAEEDAE